MTATSAAGSAAGSPPAPASSAPPPVLPAVERRAAIPGGFVAGATAVGIKASGRPDLAVIATTRGPDGRRPAAAAAVRLSRAHLAASAPPDVRAGEGSAGFATGIVVTSGCANAATGAAGDE